MPGFFLVRRIQLGFKAKVFTQGFHAKAPSEYAKLQREMQKMDFTFLSLRTLLSLLLCVQFLRAHGEVKRISRPCAK